MNNEDGYDVESTGTPDHGDGEGAHPEGDHSKLARDKLGAPDGETAGADHSPHDLEPLDDEPAQKTYREGSSAVGDAVGAFERTEDDRDIPISSPGRGGYLLPAALALFCIAITLGGYFVGAHALFPGVDDPELTISVGWRFLGLLRYLALVVFLVGCGLVSLAIVAMLLTVEFGDLSLATIRMFSCVAAMRLVAFISIATTFLESLVELLAGIAIVLILMILYFRIKIQEACLFLGMSVLCVFLIWITAYFVIWVMMG